MFGDKKIISSSRSFAPKTTETDPQVPQINNGSTSASSERSRKHDQITENEPMKTLWKIVSWTPQRCKWDPENPPQFTLALNLLFGFVSQHFHTAKSRASEWHSLSATSVLLPISSDAIITADMFMQTGSNFHSSQSLLQSSNSECPGRRVQRLEREGLSNSNHDARWLCSRTSIHLPTGRYIPEKSICSPPYPFYLNGSMSFQLLPESFCANNT